MQKSVFVSRPRGFVGSVLVFLSFASVAACSAAGTSDESESTLTSSDPAVNQGGDPSANPGAVEELSRRRRRNVSVPTSTSTSEPAPTTTATTAPTTTATSTATAAPTATPTSAPTSAPTAAPTAKPAPTSSPAPTSTTVTTSAPTLPPQYRGVNLSGAEFGSALPGTFGVDYTFPTSSEVDYYMGKGLTTFRIPFMWERVQPNAYGAFEPTYLGRLDTLVNYATSKGGHIVLNPQNFARYYSGVVGSSTVPNAQFADFWSKMAAHYAGNSKVMFGLMNEPHDLPSTQWVSAANAAIAAIRAAGAKNVIIAPGDNWTGAWTWNDAADGPANSTEMLDIVDSGNNTLFEVHQYLDTDGGGTSSDCVSTTIGSQRLQTFVAWLRAHGKKGFMGEFAGGRNATCYSAITDMLTYVKANDDVLVGWLWWGAGPWWGSSYDFALDPVNGVDEPPMALLTPFTK